MGRNTEHLPLFQEPTDRELFRKLMALGILREEEERKDWLYHVPQGEDGVKNINFEEFIASNREWYLWLLSLHHEGKTQMGRSGQNWVVNPAHSARRNSSIIGCL